MNKDEQTNDQKDANCTLEISGMDCGNCGAAVERALRTLPGVDTPEADVMGGKVRMRLDENASPDAIRTALRKSGYPLKNVVKSPEGHRWPSVAASATEAERKPWYRRHTMLIYTVVAAVACLAAVIVHFFAPAPAWEFGLALVAIITGGRYVIPAGLRSLRYGTMDINFLMSAAAIGALVIGEYVEGASVLVLFSIAEYLEDRSMARARNAVKGLMALTPAEASLIVDGQERRVAVEELAPGDIVRVRPGERIPVDGAVVSGASSVNQAAITGESLPVFKELDDEVFAGTINGEGAMDLAVQKHAEDTTLAKILHAMEEAQASRSETQRFVDRFARYYTPAVVVATILISIVPPLFFGGDWNTWVYRGLVLLVVSCPCALVIATPITMVSALGGAASAGVLVKGGRYLEAAAGIKTIVWDKTGTLTKGTFSVDAVMPMPNVEASEVLTYAALAEFQSEHHYAAAIVDHARAEGLELDPARVHSMNALVGRGVQANVDDGEVLVGNRRFFTERGVWTDDCEAFFKETSDPTSTTFVAYLPSDAPPRVLGALRLRDTLREDAAEAIRGLRGLGVSKMYMLTGDGEPAATAIAAQLKEQGAPLDEVRFGLLPTDKVDAVKALEAEGGGKIAMIGDGINDAPALAQADLGVAVGNVATDIALEAADVVIAGSRLVKLDVMMRYAQRAQRILRVNIALALGLKFLFIILAVAGLATLWMAIVADTGATLMVVLNGLRAMWLPGFRRGERIETRGS